jgi:hypothetical protein
MARQRFVERRDAKAGIHRVRQAPRQMQFVDPPRQGQVTGAGHRPGR